MELFKMIRREHAAGETIRQLAKKHNVHRPSYAVRRGRSVTVDTHLAGGLEYNRFNSRMANTRRIHSHSPSS